MRRSRSPRQPAPSLRQDWVLARDLHQSFDRIRGESRGGRHWKRRFRSCCLRLLEHLQYLIQLLVHQTWPRTSRSVLRRAGQIQGRLDQIRGGYTPERNQPLLERLDQESSEAEDSEAAETVVLTSDSEVEDPEPISVGGIWRGRFAAVRVTQSNPLIRSRSSASSANPRPAPVPPSEPVNLPRGVEIRPAISHKLQSQYVLALDWHQCLDVCRTWNGTLRPTGYRILDIFQEKIAALREIFPDLCVIILSYCHAPEFRNGVLSVPDDCIDFRVVTDKKIGPLGKLAALKARVQGLLPLTTTTKSCLSIWLIAICLLLEDSSTCNHSESKCRIVEDAIHRCGCKECRIGRTLPRCWTSSSRAFDLKESL